MPPAPLLGEEINPWGRGNSCCALMGEGRRWVMDGEEATFRYSGHPSSPCSFHSHCLLERWMQATATQMLAPYSTAFTWVSSSVACHLWPLPQGKGVFVLLMNVIYSAILSLLCSPVGSLSVYEYFFCQVLHFSSHVFFLD